MSRSDETALSWGGERRRRGRQEERGSGDLNSWGLNWREDWGFGLGVELEEERRERRMVVVRTEAEGVVAIGLALMGLEFWECVVPK